MKCNKKTISPKNDPSFYVDKTAFQNVYILLLRVKYDADIVDSSHPLVYGINTIFKGSSYTLHIFSFNHSFHHWDSLF